MKLAVLSAPYQQYDITWPAILNKHFNNKKIFILFSTFERLFNPTHIFKRPKINLFYLYKY